MQQEGFVEVVEKAWKTQCNGLSSLDRWQLKVRTLRRLVRGWALNEVASLNKHKTELALEYSNLEGELEAGILSSSEKARMDEVALEIEKIWALEEIKAKQRSRDRNIGEGDRTTTYFQVVANQRSRNKRVEALEVPNGLVVDQKGMMDIALNFYKHLFRREDRPPISLRQDFWAQEELVRASENELLIAPFLVQMDSPLCFIINFGM